MTFPAMNLCFTGRLPITAVNTGNTATKLFWTELDMQRIEVRQMTREDIPAICKADNDESEAFVNYLKEQLDYQDNKECAALLALYDNRVAGYVLLFYQCRWGALKNQGLPGICDLKVFEPYRRKGVATKLMDCAEALARRENTKLYLEVCLNADYGPAQRFYILRGYVPDGAGVYYEERVLGKDEVCRNDDELTLCLIKEFDATRG